MLTKLWNNYMQSIADPPGMYNNRSPVPGVLRKINRMTHHLFLLIAELAMVGMVVIVFMTVILRYCFSTGIGWAEEVPRLLVTLFVYIACAMGVRDHLHISVDILYNRLKVGGKARKVLTVLTDICVLICGLIMFWYGGDRFLRQMAATGTLPMTGWNTGIQYLPIPIAGFSMTFDSILFLTGVLKEDDRLFFEADVDYASQVEHLKKNPKGAEQ